MIGKEKPIFFMIISNLFLVGATQSAESLPKSPRQKILQAAELFLEEYEISYVYGGAKLGSKAECDACNACLTDRSPQPADRLTFCPVCRTCSMDCSHFIQAVFNRANFNLPYLDTNTMLTLSAQKLARVYHLANISLLRPQEWRVGDIVVFTGHVILIASQPDKMGRADVIHATGGKDIREPGQGIQRERRVDIAHFRGAALRVLRHMDLIDIKLGKLRPVSKH